MSTPLTSDNFSRTVSPGWGTASDGVSTWSGGSSNSYASVSGNEGRFSTSSPSAFPYQYVTNKTASNVEIQCRASIGATGNSIYPMTRMQSTGDPNNCYRIFLSATQFILQRVTSGVNTTLATLSVSITPGSFYQIRLRSVGSNHYAKYWLDGTSEPGNYQLTASDSRYTTGNYGIGTTLTTTTAIQVDSLNVYQVLSLTTLAQTQFVIQLSLQMTSFAHFIINNYYPQPGIAYTMAFDTFTRSNQSGWGTASDTETWSVVFGSSANYNIVNNQGVISTTAATYGILLGSGTTTSATYAVRITPSASSDYAGFTFAYVNSTNYCYTEVSNNDVAIYKVVAGTSTRIALASMSITGGISYRHLLVTNGNTANLYVWIDGQSQPGTPNVTATDPAIGALGQYGLHAFLNSNADTIKYDSYSIKSAPIAYYVSPTGNDSNPGTQSQPFATLSKASSVVGLGGTVYVLPGCKFTQPLTTNISGTPYAPISYISTTKWGASLYTSGNIAVWTNNGSYITISGFDVSASDTATRLGIINYGSRCTIQQCRVHDIQAIGSGSNGGAGIDHANYSMVYNDTIGNLVYNLGVNSHTDAVHCIYHACQYGNIKNNIVYRAGAWGIQLWHGAGNVTITNNLSFNNGYGGLIVGAQAGQGPGIDDYTVVANNIFAYNSGSYGAIVEIGPTGIHNLYINNILWQNANVGISSTQILLQNGVVDGGTMYVDPQLVNFITTGGGDYHLKSTSPAIGIGIPIYTPTTDFDSLFLRTRSLDIGPYEYIHNALFPIFLRRTGKFPTLKRRQSS